MESILEIRYIVVFQNDGLNIPGVKEILEKYGEITEIEGRPDDSMTLFLMSSDFAGYFKLKMELNCVEAEDNRYVLFPMATLNDKMAVLAARK